MKKMVAVIFLLIILLFCGCNYNNSVNKDANYDSKRTDESFTLIESGSRLTIYRENKTDVLYVVYHAGYRGGLSIMLDIDGSPLTYTNWNKR